MDPSGPFVFDKQEFSEDWVEYHIFVNVDILDDYLSYQEDESLFKRHLEGLVGVYCDLVTGWSKGYIWQKENFRLKLWDPSRKGASWGETCHLYGRTRFGDNVEDEWFVVFMLIKLSAKFPEITVNVFDNDGQFLLIEAALTLPKWLRPETCQNRVWISGGKVHLIPQPKSPAEITLIPPSVSVDVGVKLVQGTNITTAAPKPTQEAVWQRIKRFDTNDFSEFLHSSTLLLPRRLAVVLHQAPELVSAGVEAFYYRDSLQLRKCAKMEYFNPSEGCVTARVKFSRCLFAQLSSQNLDNIPKPFQPLIPPGDSPQAKAFQLGMKLACGFEILVQEGRRKRRSNPVGDAEVSDGAWSRHVKALEKVNYFQGLLEGSKRYKELLATAKEAFVRTQSQNHQRTRIRKDPSSLIEDLAQAQVPNEELSKGSNAPDDSENWMVVNPEELERMMLERQGLGFNSNSGSSPTSSKGSSKKDYDGKDVEQLLSSFNSFVNKVSSYEGAEVPKNPFEGMADLDPDKFINIMQSTLNDTLGEEGEVPNNEGEGENDDDDDDLSISDSDDETSDDEENDEEEEEGQNGGALDDVMLKYYAEMESELRSTKLSKSFDVSEDVQNTKCEAADSDDEDEDEDGAASNAELNMDLNLVKNLLESYKSQAGLAGPASTILNAMGVSLPEDDTTTAL